MSIPTAIGVCPGSETYFCSPSERARQLLFYLITCGHFYVDQTYRVSRQSYPGFLLYYICGGSLTIRYQGTTIIAKAGQVVFMDLSLPHEYYPSECAEFFYLNPDGVNTRQIWETVCREQGSFVFDSPCADRIRSQMSEIIQACRNDQLPNEVRLSEKIYAVMASFLAGCTGDSDTALADDSSVYAAVQYIRKNYQKSLTLEEIARQVNLSKYHFIRLFKQTCGCTPHEFLILTRLNRAKHLLTSTDLPIAHIAREVGYRNLATFSTMFSERVGLTPTQFRQYPL